MRLRLAENYEQFENKLRLRLKKVKVFLVETLLNLVIYVCNVHSKNTEAPLPFIIISTIVPNDTRIHGHRIYIKSSWRVRSVSTVA